MPDTLAATERLRLAEQDRLDQVKDSAERNRLGQFATPTRLAQEIAEYAYNLWKPCHRRCRFLEPAMGTGAFVSAFQRAFPAQCVSSILGVESDPEVAGVARRLWHADLVDIVIGDFTKQEPPDQRFDLIMTNPPYVRHHHIARDEKARLQNSVRRRLQLPISGLAGLYGYFLLLSHRWLAEGGLSIWLIPSEFMDVNYGSAIRTYLTDRVSLLHIHRFSPSDVQFCDALVSSVVVVFRQGRPREDHVARFSFGGSLVSPDREQSVPLHALRQTGKWTHYPRDDGTSTVEADLCLGDLFSVKRGLATGSNGFFILERCKARRMGIPEACVRPVLPSPRYLTSAVIETHADGYPILEKPLCLLDCHDPECEVKARMPELWAYLRQGMDQGVHEKYLTSRRVPWYAQERRPASPFLCTYMGRGRNGSGPFRFFWNRSAATATNVYLMMYPKEPLTAALAHKPEAAADVLEMLNGLDAQALIREGRVYGGGLHKVEPRELMRLPAGDVARLIGLVSRPKQMVFAF